jgi:hypothetical protein
VEVNAVPRIAGALTFRPTPHVDERGFAGSAARAITGATGISTEVRR